MNKKSPNDSLFKNRKFYAAVISCLGILLVMAAVVSFMNFNTVRKNQDESLAGELYSEGLEPTLRNDAQSYLTPEDREQESAFWRKNEEEQEEANPEESPAPVQENGQDSQSRAVEPKQPETTEPPVQETESSAADPEKPADVNTEEEQKEETETSSTQEELAAPIFNAFDAAGEMLWPVSGEIVMDYSIDRTIYDMTLDQYRTNDSICIAAPAGTQVRSAADGVVLNVYHSKETGNTVVIDNGNGWLTTYSQLQDQVLVSEGDVVKAGQVIGGVNNPTIFSVMLGSHLNFSVMQDDMAVDPKAILAAQ